MNISSKPASMAGLSGYPTSDKSTDLGHYKSLSDSVTSRQLVSESIIPAKTGKAFRVAQGEIIRITCHEGPQVADLIVFNSENPTEQFWQARTRVIYGGHLKVGDQLWSVPPWTRPMMTLITDTLDHAPLEGGARAHDLLYCRCDARLYQLVHKRDGVNANCNDNLANAIAEFGLSSEQVHDPFNIFMTTGLNSQGKPFYLPSNSRKGDYVDLIAEMNTLVAISACPGGSSGSQSHGLKVEIFAGQ